MSVFYKVVAFVIEMVACAVVLWLIRREAKIVKFNVDVEPSVFPKRLTYGTIGATSHGGLYLSDCLVLSGHGWRHVALVGTYPVCMSLIRWTPYGSSFRTQVNLRPRNSNGYCKLSSPNESIQEFTIPIVREVPRLREAIDLEPKRLDWIKDQSITPVR
jgi:hypothetical protein